MTRAHALREEVELLPIDERLLMVDRLLRSLHGADSGNDRKWLAAANQRLREVKSGRVKPLPGRAVLAEARLTLVESESIMSQRSRQEAGCGTKNRVG